MQLPTSGAQSAFKPFYKFMSFHLTNIHGEYSHSSSLLSVLSAREGGCYCVERAEDDDAEMPEGATTIPTISGR